MFVGCCLATKSLNLNNRNGWQWVLGTFPQTEQHEPEGWTKMQLSKCCDPHYIMDTASYLTENTAVLRCCYSVCWYKANLITWPHYTRHQVWCQQVPMGAGTRSHNLKGCWVDNFFQSVYARAHQLSTITLVVSSSARDTEGDPRWGWFWL